MRLADIRSFDSHHAYIVVGDLVKGVLEIEALLKKQGVEPKGNPDVRVHVYTELLVDDARDTLLSYASLKPLGERKYLIVSFSRANNEAQSALLKAVEDSLGKTTFFFVVESPGHVIPTLRSRAITVRTAEAKDGENETAEDAKRFLKANYAERLSTVEKMAGYISKTQDRAPMRAFLTSLLILGRGEKLPAQSLRDILSAVGYARMQGSSAKAFLGHLAVSLPRGG